MNKQEIYAFLRNGGYWHEITEHPAVYTMEEVAHLALPHPEAEAKNLFVRDDKKQNYCLLTVKDGKRVDLARFRREQGTRRLSFASSEELMQKLSLRAGSVTPLGALNCAAGEVTVYLDREFLDGNGLIGVHPNENTATLVLKTAELIGILNQHGTKVILADF